LILELLTGSVEETIKRASVVSSTLSNATQGFVTGSQRIMDLIQFSCIVRRAISDILVVGCRFMQQPAIFQITKIDYSGAIPPPLPQRMRKKNPKRVSADSNITLSSAAAAAALSAKFTRKRTTELKDFHHKVQRDSFSLTNEDSDEQQKHQEQEQEQVQPKEEQKKSSFFSFKNSSYFNENTLNIVGETRNTINGAIREGFEVTSGINRTLKAGFLLRPQIISTKQSIYDDSSRSDRHAKSIPKLTDTSRAEQVIEPNYQSLSRAPYKHDDGSKDEPLQRDESKAEPYQSSPSSSGGELPRQAEGTKSSSSSHPAPLLPPNVDKKMQSHSWKIPEVIAASLPSMLYRSLQYNDIMGYTKINLDEVEKIAQLPRKIVFDRILYGSKQVQEEEKKKQAGQTIQKLEQSDHEKSHTQGYDTAISDTAKISGNVNDNYYYSFVYPAIIAKTLSQRFRFPNPSEIFQRFSMMSSSHVPDAIRFAPQKIASSATHSSGKTDDKIPNSDDSHSSSPFPFPPLLNSTLTKNITSAMGPIVSTEVYRLTESVSSLTIAADNVPLQRKRRVITPQQNAEAPKSMTTMTTEISMANKNSDDSNEPFVDGISGKYSRGHFTNSASQYDKDDTEYYHLRRQYKAEDEELELRDLKRKIEQILNEELRKYGFQI
jgi:hypothetical protein